MSEATPAKGWRFPNAFTILIALILAVAALTWVIPSGQYSRVASEVLGKEVPLPGTYALTPGNPQGMVEVILAPVADFAGVPRSLVVTAFATASGWLNLIAPIFAVVMGGLAIGRVPYQRWLGFV